MPGVTLNVSPPSPALRTTTGDQTGGTTPTQPTPDSFEPRVWPIGPPSHSTAEVVTQMAQSLLSMERASATPADAQRLLDANPGLARSLRLFSARYQAAPAWQTSSVAMQALRSHLANSGQPVKGLSERTPPNSLALVSEYAKDLGYAYVGFENNEFTIYDNQDAPQPLTFDPTGALTVEQALNMQRFGRAVMVPPTGVLDITAAFSLNNAHTANHLALLSYGWGTTARSQLEQWGFDISTFSWLHADDSDTAGFVVADVHGNIYLSLRGTDSLTDVGTDANAQMTRAAWSAAQSAFRVHRGFDRALDTIWPQLKDAIARAESKVGKNGQRFFAGHSLGGALTELAALRLSDEGLLDTSKAQVYTNGAPRIGDQALADAFNARLPSTYRMVNQGSGSLGAKQDVVPTLPPKAMGFRHVGNLVRLSDDGYELVQLPSTPHGGSNLTDPDGQVVPSVFSHLSGLYLERTGHLLWSDWAPGRPF